LVNGQHQPIFIPVLVAFVPCPPAPSYQATPESAMGARHMGYSEGVRTPPRRETADDRQRAAAAKWGFTSQAVRP
jgi:hypothetical protein